MKTYSRRNSSYLKKAFVASNFNETCRLCLSETDVVMIPIFQKFPISYQEWIHYSVDVLVEEGDGLPTGICEECSAMVKQTYLFKKKCKASDAKLREHLQLIELHEENRINEMNFEEPNEEPDLLKEQLSATATGELLNTTEKNANKDDSLQCGSNEEAYIQGGNDLNNVGNSEKEITSSESEGRGSEFECVKMEENLSENLLRTYVIKNHKRDESCQKQHELTQLQNAEFILVRREEDSVESSLENEEVDKSGTRIQEICQLWDNDDDELCNKEEEEQSVILNVTWEDSNRNDDGPETDVIEVRVEENGVIQTHKVVTSEDRIHVIEAVPERKVHRCGSCGSEFSSSFELKKHLYMEHKEVADVTFCEICMKSFTCMNSLKRHMSVHTGIKPHVCSVCERAFSQASILKRHMFTHGNSKPFACRYCKKSYTQKMNLLTHLRNHGFKAEKESYRCKVCSKSFVHPSGLSRHIKSHKGIRFLCPHCSKSFSDSSAMTRHVKAHHAPATKDASKST